MDKVVVLAGGPWQMPLVLFLKKKGHYVCVVNPSRTETVAAADFHIEADVNDSNTINHHIARINPLFITSDQSDISTLSVAALSETWGLPGNKPSVVEKFTNKSLMAEFARSLGIVSPLTQLVSSAEDVRDFATHNNLPLVLKPTDATNSRGFRKLETLEGLEEIFPQVRGFSKSGQVIVQAFAPGDLQITLDGVCSGGRHRTLATSKKGRYFKPGLTSCVRYPSRLPPALLDKIVRDNDRYVERAGMQFGLTHGEYIVSGEDYSLIEIAGRGAGAGITDKITPWVSGIHPYEVLYESLMGRVVDVRSLSVTDKPAILQFYHEEQMAHCQPAQVAKIEQILGVASFHYDFRSKQFTTDPYNPRHSMGVYLANSEGELDSILEAVSLQIGREG